jgi:excisionase family DNA binding protein
MTTEDALNEIMALVAARNKAPQLLDVKEAANVLAVSQSTIRRMISLQKIAHVQVEGAVRLDMADLKEYVKRNKTRVHEVWR